MCGRLGFRVQGLGFRLGFRVPKGTKVAVLYQGSMANFVGSYPFPLNLQRSPAVPH